MLLICMQHWILPFKNSPFFMYKIFSSLTCANAIWFGVHGVSSLLSLLFVLVWQLREKKKVLNFYLLISLLLPHLLLNLQENNFFDVLFITVCFCFTKWVFEVLSNNEWKWVWKIQSHWLPWSRWYGCFLCG